MEPKEKFRALVIDDEEHIIRGFQLAFENEWEVVGILHPDELKKDMQDGFKKFKLFDLIFLDLMFDTKVQLSAENVLQKIEKGELLGIQFLEWLAENYPCPVIVLSGFLFDRVTERLRKVYPYILLKAKPVDLYERTFRPNMEWYAEVFRRHKYEFLYNRPLKEAIKQFDELMAKNPNL